jgi:ElaA protein
MDFVIKHFDDLTNDELYKILKARIDVFVVEQNCPYEECDNKDYDSIHIFSQENNEIIAYLRIIPAGVSYKEPSIGRVLVAKEYRRQGIAKKMMNKALVYISNNFENDSIRISAQKYLLDFYKSLGFEEVSDEYLEDGIPHHEMLYKY